MKISESNYDTIITYATRYRSRISYQCVKVTYDQKYTHRLIQGVEITIDLKNDQK